MKTQRTNKRHFGTRLILIFLVVVLHYLLVLWLKEPFSEKRLNKNSVLNPVVVSISIEPLTTPYTRPSIASPSRDNSERPSQKAERAPERVSGLFTSAPVNIIPQGTVPSQKIQEGEVSVSETPPLDLILHPKTVTMLNPIVSSALGDPRSNSQKLTFSDKYSIALGIYDCVLAERMVDGSIRRFAGQFTYVLGSGAAGIEGRNVKVCQSTGQILE